MRSPALIFPYPARMAYWTHKSPFFSKELTLLEERWSLEKNFLNFTAEIKEAILSKDFDKLEEYSTQVKEEIEDIEEKLYLIPTLLLLGLVLLQVVKPLINN